MMSFKTTLRCHVLILTAALAIAGCSEPAGDDAVSDAGVDNDVGVDTGDSGLDTGDSGPDADTGHSEPDADTGDTGDSGLDTGDSDDSGSEGEDAISPCAGTTCLHYSLKSDQGTEELYYVDLAAPGQAFRIDDASKTEPILEGTKTFTSDATAMVFAREEGDTHVLYRVELDDLQNETIVDPDFPGGALFRVEGSQRLRGNLSMAEQNPTPYSFLPTSPVSYAPLSTTSEQVSWTRGNVVTADGQTSVVEVNQDEVRSLYKAAFDGSTAPEQLTIDGTLYRWSLDPQARRIALIIEKNGVHTLEVGSLDTWTERETITFDSGIGDLDNFMWGPGADELVFITYDSNTGTSYINWRNVATDENIASGVSLGEGFAYCLPEKPASMQQSGTLSTHPPHRRDILVCAQTQGLSEDRTFLIRRDDPTTVHTISDQVAGKFSFEDVGFVALLADSIYFTGEHPDTGQRALFHTNLESPTMAEVASSPRFYETMVSPNGEWMAIFLISGSFTNGFRHLSVVRFDALDSPITLIEDYQGDITMDFIEVF